MFKCILFALMFIVQQSFYAGSFRSHVGNSPWSFTAIAEPSDTFVVNDTDAANLDRPEMFSKHGSIYIDIPIRRYVGVTDSNGYLLNASAMVANRIISSTAQIFTTVYGIHDDPFVNDWFDCDKDGIIDDMLVHKL